jgi:hypothetical protein
MAPATAPKPKIIKAQVAGSGTAPVVPMRLETVNLESWAWSMSLLTPNVMLPVYGVKKLKTFVPEDP